MTQSETAQTGEAVRRALADGHIPAHLQAAAGALLQKLDQPVGVTLFGLPGSGKSSVVNLLLGREVIPAGISFPTLKISGGPDAASSGVLADGSPFRLSGFDPVALASKAAVYIEARLPLPALNQISVTEIVAPDAAALERAVPWAADRTGISLWCTQEFGAAEQAAWSRASEQMKDSAFLLVTKADDLAAQGRLQPVLAALQDGAAEQFNQLLPLATLEAQAARHPDGAVDRDRLRRSGGQALISVIMHEVKLQRQAALDQADSLLRKYRPATPKADPAPAVSVLPEAEAVHEQAAMPAVAAAPAPNDVQARPAMPATIPPEQPEAVTAADTPVPPPTAVPGAAADPALGPEIRQAYDQALDYLSGQAQSLSQTLQTKTARDHAPLIRQTLQSVQWLSEHLDECGNGSDGALAQMRGAVSEAEDLLHLIQVEEDETSLFDATSILLQLKRDMQAQLAA
ncbi:hypothetical protein KQ247_14060 [Ruegeria pomeroyi]|uniref:G domain-containing protein n=2 Tax=Ruegeria pomeroyi TaxID=89184 RepID=Q5LUI9_RUEPO|nr:hypothetical protein [Ruegeria pomeroyi]AAV94365.1 hypothetical protein SPO1065 [Ruegeria pomeroyi DSS-3]NVK97473.1 hypothetical protein [Ruegeria pomeroyi]NVL01488.1 hypothetical protein [Ruegeria pomeroyi]QWV07950.1 hypothetical protein KQ247_14060 [Ruegeria pomeroyi]